MVDPRIWQEALTRAVGSEYYNLSAHLAAAPRLPDVEEFTMFTEEEGAVRRGIHIEYGMGGPVGAT